MCAGISWETERELFPLFSGGHEKWIYGVLFRFLWVRNWLRRWERGVKWWEKKIKFKSSRKERKKVKPPLYNCNFCKSPFSAIPSSLLTPTYHKETFQLNIYGHETFSLFFSFHILFNIKPRVTHAAPPETYSIRKFKTPIRIQFNLALLDTFDILLQKIK